MRTLRGLALMAVVLIMSVPALAQSSWILYDSFSAPLIDPAKWFGSESSPGMGTEAIRAAVFGRLSMFYRSYGSTSSDSGGTDSGLGLVVTNPDAITGIRGDVTIWNAAMTTCPANLEESTQVRARVGGRFFNAGTPIPGSFLDDVAARIIVRRVATTSDPSGIFQVRGSVFRCTDAECNDTVTLGAVTLGTVGIGQPASIGVAWDQDFKKFVFQFGSATAEIPYFDLPDVAQPGRPGKSADIQLLVSNCQSAPRSTASLGVFFDNIMVKNR